MIIGQLSNGDTYCTSDDSGLHLNMNILWPHYQVVIDILIVIGTCMMITTTCNTLDRSVENHKL